MSWNWIYPSYWFGSSSSSSTSTPTSLASAESNVAEPTLAVDEPSKSATDRPRPLSKQEALEACGEALAELKRCYGKSWMFTNCGQQSNAFWECYQQKRGSIKTKLTGQRELAPPPTLKFFGDSQDQQGK